MSYELGYIVCSKDNNIVQIVKQPGDSDILSQFFFNILLYSNI